MTKNEWTTGEDVTKNIAKKCSWCDDLPEVKIYLTQEIFSVIKKLCKEIRREWQMLLKGKEDDKGDVYVDGYYIPKQETTGASVKNLDCIDKKFIEENNIIATIHSHGEMAVHFSGTDDEFTNLSLIKHHIVVNNDAQWKACTQVNLPCGKIILAEATAKLEKEDDVDVEGIERIKEREYFGRHFVEGLGGMGAGFEYHGKKKKKKKKHAITNYYGGHRDEY